MDLKKITIFAGHYGSGKTNLAVNLALYHRKIGHKVSLCDLDIVNPYFRSKDSQDILERAGVNFISSEFANSNLDVPSIPAAAYSVFVKNDSYSVIDLGGDDRGSYALGRFSEFLQDSSVYDMLLVVNQYRPDTATPELTLEITREIEAACHVRFTGIVNNSNLGKITDKKIIEDTNDYAASISELLELPLVMTTYRSDIKNIVVPNPFPIELVSKDIWII